MRLVLLGAALVAASACSTSVRLMPDVQEEHDPCSNVDCGLDETCVDGACVPVDPCAGVACDPGQVCVGGACVNERLDADGDGFPARNDCDDHDAQVFPGVARDCRTDCGQGVALCLPAGRWSDCSAPLVCDCRPGDERVEPCGNCGEARRRCRPDGTWDVAPPQCLNQRECSPGAERLEPCDDGCRQRLFVCNQDCRWSDGGDCLGNEECLPAETQTNECGFCGTQTSVCTDRCLWDPGECVSDGVCAPGDVDEGPCGNCGTRSRRCLDGCQWSMWGACAQDQGACQAGSSQTLPCGCLDLAVQGTRTCGVDCAWGPVAECPGCLCNFGERTACPGETQVIPRGCGEGSDRHYTCREDNDGVCSTVDECLPAVN